MLRELKKWKPFLHLNKTSMCSDLLALHVEDGLVPVMGTDGCLTYFECFMPRKSRPQWAEKAAISAPAGELLIRKK